MTYALKIAKSKFLLTLPASLKVALAAAEAVGLPKEHIFLLEGKAEGFLTIQDLMEIGKQYTPSPAIGLPRGKTNREVCGFLNFSSGTTGLPKAVRLKILYVELITLTILMQVMLSHHNVIAQCLQLRQLQAPGPYKILAVMPLFHSEFPNIHFFEHTNKFV